MSLKAVANRLKEEGFDADAILKVILIHEEDRIAKEDAKRAKAAEKKRRQRAEEDAKKLREAAAASPSVPGTSGDKAGQKGTEGDIEGQAGTEDARTHERARVEDITPKLVISGVTVTAAETREVASDWPTEDASRLVDLLADEIGTAWLDRHKWQGLNLTLGYFTAWKRDGASWRNDVVPVVRALCAKQRKPVNSWKFFDDAVRQSIADNRAALAMPAAGEVVPLRPGGGASLPDRIAAENAEARRRAFAMLDQKNGKSC